MDVEDFDTNHFKNISDHNRGANIKPLGNSEKPICENINAHGTSEEKAERYCQKCLQALCASCVLDFHQDHLSEAKFKFEDVSSRTKDQLKILSVKIENHLNNSFIRKKIDDKLHLINKSLSEISEVNELYFLRFKSKLDSLNEYQDKIIKEISSGYKKNLDEKVKSKEYQDVITILNNLNDSLNRWPSSNLREIVNLNKNLKSIENEAFTKMNSFSSESRDESVKINDLEKAIKLIQEKLNLEKAFSNLDNQLQEIQNNLRKVSEELIKEKIDSKLNNLPIIQPKKVDEPVNDHQSTPQGNNFNPFETPKPTNQFSDNFEYLAAFKKSNEIIILNLKSSSSSLISLKIDETMFIDQKLLPFPLDYSKYINLGNSVLITGGIEKSQALNNCYLLQIENQKDKCSVSITNYSAMMDKRERHNIIFLDDINSVLVCGGFYTKSAEITNLNEPPSWQKISQMKEQRANATMLYVNKKTVYCLGGFQITEGSSGKDRSNGTYSGSCEYIDIKTGNSSWNLIDIEKIFNVNMKFCAMGVIYTSTDQILLVGGYDGIKYLSDVTEITLGNDSIKKIANIGRKPGLVKGVIFPSSSKFIRKDDRHFVNFDFQNRIVTYDLSQKDFTL